jgi:hypothetical protein
MQEELMKIVRTGRTRFHFVGDAGAPPATAASIGVVSIEDSKPVWWIASEEYSELWAPDRAIEISELSAPESRHIYESFTSKTVGASVSEVTYGVLPAGFRQLTPEAGFAPTLDLGRRYVLHFLGSEAASLEFDF